MKIHTGSCNACQAWLRMMSFICKPHLFQIFLTNPETHAVVLLP